MAYFEMSWLALKWAFKKPVTTQYPFEARRPMAGSRGRLAFVREHCVFCGVCVKKCPTGAIRVDRGRRTWGIDRLRCISCGYCVELCPKKSLELTTNHETPTVSKDREWC